MFETSADANKFPFGTPRRFLLRVCILIRECHGLPNEGFEPSKLDARAMFLKLERVPGEDAAKRVLLRHPKEARALLGAIISEMHRRNEPLSLPDIALAKIEDTEWATKGFQDFGAQWFFRDAVENLQQ